MLMLMELSGMMAWSVAMKKVRSGLVFFCAVYTLLGV